MSNTPALPSIAVVTPSFNHGKYLEASLRSVREQDYPKLEHVVIDGGSTDDSVAIIQRHASSLAAWVSEPDKGSYDAVRKGIAMTKGEIIGWINSDDIYLPGALKVVGDIFARFPGVEWISTLFPILLDKEGRAVRADWKPGFSREGFMAGEYLPAPGAFSFGHVQQESTFFRRSLWECVGGEIDPEFRLAGDFALWAQFFQHADLVGVATPLAAYRIHGEQVMGRDRGGYGEECERVLQKYGGRRGGEAHRWMREIARRFPVAAHAGLARMGAMQRARVVRWDLAAGAWQLEECFI